MNLKKLHCLPNCLVILPMRTFCNLFQPLWRPNILLVCTEHASKFCLITKCSTYPEELQSISFIMNEQRCSPPMVSTSIKKGHIYKQTFPPTNLLIHFSPSDHRKVIFWHRSIILYTCKTYTNQIIRTYVYIRKYKERTVIQVIWPTVLSAALFL